MDFCSHFTEKKLDYLEKIDLPFQIKEKNIYHLISKGFGKKINVLFLKKNINDLKKKFIDYNDNSSPIINNKFRIEIKQMDGIICYTYPDFKVTVHILYHKNDNHHSLQSIIMHSLSTFFNSFNYNYQNLEIYIALTNNRRIVDFEHKKTMTNEYIFKHLIKNAGGFVPSAVTDSNLSQIISTRKEDIIRLMFHELVHYIKLDFFLYNKGDQLPLLKWPGQNYRLHYFEAYAEFMSIILNSCYLSLHVQRLNPSINGLQYYHHLLKYEIVYSFWLSTNLLRFSNFNKSNFLDFFEGKHIVDKYPSKVWEYIILRTQLLFSINEMNPIIKEKYITEQNINLFLKLVIPSKQMLQYMEVFFDFPTFNDVSYSLFDCDWDHFNNTYHKFK